MSAPEGRILSYGRALNEAMREELERDDRVFVMGQDVGAHGGVFGITKTLYDTFGPDRVIDFRVSTLPTLFGEKIVVRILDPSSARLGIDALGYDADEKARLLHAIGRPYGMVLVTGPTGSGKTVSLYTCLNLLNQPGVNIATAEDPSEINLPGVNQVNVNERAGLTFAAALRAAR